MPDKCSPDKRGPDKRNPDKRNLGRILVAGLLRGYQLVLSPIYGPVCRYAPSCSHYAHDAVLMHGPVRGGWLALRRLARCHPWGGSGFDPVPETELPAIGRRPAQR
jgi:putative membrane protein insertion efficiency factor